MDPVWGEIHQELLAILAWATGWTRSTSSAHEWVSARKTVVFKRSGPVWVECFGLGSPCLVPMTSALKLQNYCHCIKRKSREQGATVVLKIVPATSSLHHTHVNYSIPIRTPESPRWIRVNPTNACFGSIVKMPDILGPTKPAISFWAGRLAFQDIYRYLRSVEVGTGPTNITRKSSRNSQTPWGFQWPPGNQPRQMPHVNRNGWFPLKTLQSRNPNGFIIILVPNFHGNFAATHSLPHLITLLLV